MSQTDTHHVLPVPEIPKGTKLLIVRAPYYKEVGDNLLKGAADAIKRHGATSKLLDVPGALEIPTAIALAAGTEAFDGYVALGCVIRGETTHYETVCNDSSRGLTLLGLQGHCIGNGILTVENITQAEVRADPAGQNKGGGAAEAALHLIAARTKFGAPAAARKSSFAPASEEFQIASKS